MPQHFRLLTEQQVHSLLPMPDLIAAMESALAKFSAREVLQQVRSVLTVGPTKAYFGLMPAYVPTPASLGAKLVTVFGGNLGKGLPSHLATILLLFPALVMPMSERYRATIACASRRTVEASSAVRIATGTNPPDTFSPSACAVVPSRFPVPVMPRSI